MNEVVDDLKQIKKYYGEDMMHLCRTIFPIILEKPGLLTSLMLANFEPNHSLYEDLDINRMTSEFKSLIYSYLESQKPENKNKLKNIKTPEQLLEEAGYVLYPECQIEQDIQSFKKYYAKKEEICTFHGNRLDSCRVFFAVKKNVDEIKRDDFSNPERQDEYGTSVISIQFTKDGSNTLSIKNRYNHRISNPDSTFSNNLDNIIEGLTQSFEKYYGIKQINLNTFELRGYVRANDGKYYKFNTESENVYYCPNNIIIDNFEVKRLEKEKYVLVDYYIIDLVNKKINFYDGQIKQMEEEKMIDSFVYSIPDIEKISIIKEGSVKRIIISSNGKEDVIIKIDKDNKIIELVNNNIEEVGDYFLASNIVLNKIELKKLRKVGREFLGDNHFLTSIELPSLEEVGDSFINYNSSIIKIDCPLLKKIGNDFLSSNYIISSIYIPKLRKTGKNFLSNNKALTSIELPSLEEIDDGFLESNKILKTIILPSLTRLGHYNSFLNGIDIELKQKIMNILEVNNSRKTK